MKMKKILSMIAFFTYFCNMLTGQNYNIILDASGTKPTIGETQVLTLISDSIAQIWPSSTNVQFKTYAFSNYVLNDYMSDFTDIWS
jgi:hypothetical protein